MQHEKFYLHINSGTYKDKWYHTSQRFANPGQYSAIKFQTLHMILKTAIGNCKFHQTGYLALCITPRSSFKSGDYY